MKKSVVFVWALILLFALFSCVGRSGDEPKTELTVFAAASMQETLTEIGEMYMKEHEDITIVFNFDSSGTLKTQIWEGAECDLFVSAGRKQIDELEEAGLLLEDSRLDLLENKMVLAVPAGNSKGIESYDDLKAALENGDVLLAMGNSDVPVGQYTQKILAYLGLNEEELAQKGCITYASNVKEVTTQVKEGAVDCGIVYSTDAFSADLTVVDTATAEMCGQVIYPVAVLEKSKEPETAQDFLNFVRSQTGKAVLESVGFSPIG